MSAIASRGDGVKSLLHEPLTGTDFNVFRFDLAPNGLDVDLVRVRVRLRLRLRVSFDLAPNGLDVDLVSP